MENEDKDEDGFRLDCDDLRAAAFEILYSVEDLEKYSVKQLRRDIEDLLELPGK